jgi:hypothetical protein
VARELIFFNKQTTQAGKVFSEVARELLFFNKQTQVGKIFLASKQTMVRKMLER